MSLAELLYQVEHNEIKRKELFFDNNLEQRVIDLISNSD